MKRKLVIVMITTGLSTMNTSVEHNNLNLLKDPVRVENKMGRGPNCLGRGLCSITGGGEKARNPDAEFSSELSFDKHGHILMKIARSDLSQLVFEEQFENNEFILVEGFELPRLIMEEMGINNKTYTIPEGVYPVQLTETEVVVVFDVQFH